MAKPTVVLVSTMISPFQVELARAVRDLGEIDYHLLFTVRRSGQRGGHWTRGVAEDDFLRIAPEWKSIDELVDWVRRELARIRPDVVIATGLLRSPTYRTVSRLRRELGDTPVGLWLEHPDLSRPLHVRLAIEAVTRVQLSRVDFVMAIGDRAERYYHRCGFGRVPTHVVPYGQDLSDSLEIVRNGLPERTTFLFSGQLVPRNNIENLVRAFGRLAKSHPGQWRWIVAAYGPEKRHIDALTARSAVAREAISFDTDYETWADRLRPFANSDVLVCPSHHAGWALVVPEAMAAGMPVIATRYVNAARYLVRPEISGLFVRTDPASIARAMVRFIEDPPALRRMGEAARRASNAGTAEFVAERFTEVALRYAQR